MRTPQELCLGTVKLGLPDYGFSSGKTSKDFDVLDFLNSAGALGITHFDTSPRYGKSEEILGKYISRAKNKPRVSSKIDGLKPRNPKTPQIMLESVKKSLERLRLEALNICYLHQNELDIISDNYVHEGLELLKKERLASFSGASLYSREECAYALKSGIYNVIQVPVNVFDLNLYNNFIKNNACKARFAARSLLLQGILTNRDTIARRFKQSGEILDYLNKLDGITKDCCLTTLEMAFAFVFSLKNIEHFIIGTTSIENLKQDISCLKIKLPEKLYGQLFEAASSEKEWSNPNNWQLIR